VIPLGVLNQAILIHVLTDEVRDVRLSSLDFRSFSRSKDERLISNGKFKTFEFVREDLVSLLLKPVIPLLVFLLGGLGTSDVLLIRA
jgi:hypothetical protein